MPGLINNVGQAIQCSFEIAIICNDVKEQVTKEGPRKGGLVGYQSRDR